MTPSTETRSAHRLGILLVTASSVVFSLAGALTKAIKSDAWTIACWRGLLGGALVLLYVAWLDRGKPLPRAFALGWQSWMLATVRSCASLAFIFAFKLTYLANVAVIFATAPFMSASLGWILLDERLPSATLIAAVMSLFGVILVVVAGIGAGKLPGDLLALLMTLGNALYVVLIRMFKDTPVVLAGGVSGLQLFVVGWFVVDPLAVSRPDALLLALFGLSFAVAVVLMTEGARLIPAAKASLLGSAETPSCSPGSSSRSCRRPPGSSAAPSSLPPCSGTRLGTWPTPPKGHKPLAAGTVAFLSGWALDSAVP